jgi:hypothetical protein
MSTPSRILIAALLLCTACTPSEEVPDIAVAASQATVVESVSTPGGEGWYSISPDESTVVFGRHDENWSNHVILFMEQTESGWSEAAPMPFSGTFNDRGARYYPALNVMLMSSNRPLPGEDEAADFNLWVVAHDGEEWMPPEPFMAANSDDNDFHGSVSASGTIYFSSNREGGQGRSDIYKASLGSMGYEVEPVAGPVNTIHSESDVWVDPGERYLIFSRTDDPEGFGGDDLWITFAGQNGWSAPVNLGEAVNSSDYEYGAWVTRDGATLYFTTHRDGQADIARIDLADLSVEGPQGWTTGSVD